MSWRNGGIGRWGWRGALVALALLAPLPGLAQERPVVAAVNYPLAWMAERLGGDAVEVLFPVPPGRDPAFWRPGVADIATIQQAQVIALNGAGFAAWTDRASLPRAATVDTSAGFADAFIATDSVTHSHGAEGAHSHEATASFTWLDFDLAARQATALADAMTRRLPALEGRIAEGLAAVQADLSALDAAAMAAGAALRGTPIVASHPRYQYFARAYGLDIRALDWATGEMPDDAQWAALAALRDETGAGLFIWEAAPADAAAARLAEAGLTGVVFPPLAERPAAGDFASVMADSIAALAAAGS